MLAACGTLHAPPPTVSEPAPRACDPRLLAQVVATPEQPDDARLVKPATPEERDAVGRYLGWVAEVIGISLQNQGRAVLAKAECERR